jgi:hypothetical protein
MKLFVKDIVDDTYTNASGYSLFTILKDYLHKGQFIVLSFKGSTPPSSSFLNSSIGELLDEFGFNKFKKMVNLVDLTPTQAQVLKNYFNSCMTEW